MKTKVNYCKATDILFGFTKPDLREDHANITLNIILPIKERKDAYDFVDKLEKMIINGDLNESK